jgi:hypothetical protein
MPRGLSTPQDLSKPRDLSISRVCTAVATFLTAGAVAAVPSVAAAAPAATVSSGLSFHLPATGGLEIPPADVPGGSFRQITVTASQSPRTLQFPPPPAAVTFTVRNVAPHYPLYEYRYLRVGWRNLASGKTGTVDLRHWRTRPSSTGYPASLQTEASVTTGGGPVVATISVLREQYQSPPTVISVIPGVIALDVAR